ncbi:MAG: hypothetical protein IPI28_07360 [Candidatus Omnitrophica bacterium]|nr:hypothetical protein [Candidatus Omnitrophota bacterium]
MGLVKERDTNTGFKNPRIGFRAELRLGLHSDSKKSARQTVEQRSSPTQPSFPAPSGLSGKQALE